MSNERAEGSALGFHEVEPNVWQLEPTGAMRVPGRIFASRELVDALDEKVREQISNVAALPGIVGASFAMPDAHWGYGFPIGGVAAFDPDRGGIVSAGGVGFDISCGVRTFTTGMKAAELGERLETIAHDLYRTVPAGVGWGGAVKLTLPELDEALAGGAAWAVEKGWGEAEDLERIEEGGRMPGAEPSRVSRRAKERQLHEVGSLGSGNHYLELQAVEQVYDAGAATAYRLAEGDLLVTIHCGSRGLGHQIGTEYLQKFVSVASRYGIALPDRELACAPIRSPEGQDYLGAMRAAINCALANRQVIGALVRKVFARHFPSAKLRLLYDVSHNTCKAEEHEVDGKRRLLFVHRKGATRALGPGHEEVPLEYRAVGQPVLIGGTMGTASYVLAGTTLSESRAFSSSCHGAGRKMSRTKAKTLWQGKPLIRELAEKGIVIKSHTARGAAEEAPGAYKDVDEVARVAEEAGLSRRVARVLPIACVKG
jgi:tRNA-splicing ligase RtcB